MTTKRKLIAGYEEWLSRFTWAWFATLTFRRPNIPAWRANALFDQWIAEVQGEDGTADFRWFRVVELGANQDHLHFHVLVGGLANGTKWPWVILWNEIAGDCLISYYSAFKGTLPYLLKEVHPDRDCAIECNYDFFLPLPAKKGT